MVIQVDRSYRVYTWHTRVHSILTLLGYLILGSCASLPASYNNIVGTWMMEKVYEYDRDVTRQHNPQGNRRIKFEEEGLFISDGDPFGRNTGRWRIEAGGSVLFLDSDVDDDDSEWNVQFKRRQMIWTGIGHPRKKIPGLYTYEKEIDKRTHG